MDFFSSKDYGEDKQRANNNSGMCENESNLKQNDNDYPRGETQDLTEWPSTKDDGCGNADYLNLQRLAREHQRSPFPDFQFEILDDEADTDDNGCEYNLATGTRKKPPTRMDSWEDNWLFQQKKCKNSQTAKDGCNTLMSMKMYGTIDEQRTPGTEDYEKDESDASECSGDCKSNEVQRVERPCVRTSSSSSDAEESEESESSESPSRNVNYPSNDSDDKIPFLESNPTSENSDSTDSNGQAIQLPEQENIPDMPPAQSRFSRERSSNLSNSNSMEDLQRRKEGQYTRKTSKTKDSEEVDSDDSIKDELVNAHEDKPSHPDNPLLPKFLIERSYSPRPVSGARSCTSEDSSSDEFEKKAAAYKSRRRASWCPLETPVTPKNRGKRRQPLLPLRLEEDEPEMEIKPMATDEEALVGLERQMLRRDARHSSFRAKKASPNFVLNPLYVPEVEGAQNPRRGPDAIQEPNAMHYLQPSESGYSSCSPDSMINPNNMILPQRDRNFHLGVRQDDLNPTQNRKTSDQKLAPAHPDSSFLW